MAPAVTIRPMVADDLSMVERWLRSPHVARWFTRESTPEKEVEKYRRRIGDPAGPTVMCIVELGGVGIGWCQWYRWKDYPQEAASYGAQEDDVGADYAIGERRAVGRGVGTELIARLVAEVRRHVPGAHLLIAPEAENRASRRVLENNRFELLDVRPVLTEPHSRPMAIYRLD